MVFQIRKRLKTNEAAEYIGVAPGTLVVWRSTKRVEIPYYKVGGSVRYAIEDLEAFLQKRRVEPLEAR